VELLVTMAVIGILATLSVPTFISYWRAATLKGGAQELRTILNQARHLAITTSTTVCVSQGANNKVRFLVGGCTGTVWTGPGSDGNGWFSLQNGVTVTSNPLIVFNSLGAATTAGSYTVQNPIDNATLTVTVSKSGRISTP
jgi:Tfp pilus assembly protein FimT